jgi:G3E family GTPase
MRIPTHIVTGFLGVGKTTALNHLIRQKPEHEKWALVINEFGHIGVDQTLFEADDTLSVREIPGGCVCCTMGPALTIQLAMMIRRVQPDRILIEPTGLGHPAALIDLIMGESFNESLDLKSVITLMDPRALDDEKTRTFPTFIDQLQMADTVVLNKTDVCDSAHITKAHEFLSRFYPPKTHIFETQHGALTLDQLVEPHQVRDAVHPNFHKRNKPQAAVLPESLLRPQSTGNSISLPSMNFTPLGEPHIEFYHDADAFGVSVQFHPDELIDLERLDDLLSEYASSLRVKALIRGRSKSVMYNQVQGQCDRSESAWRRDSRIEIIQLSPFDQERVSTQIMGLIS